MSSPAGVASQSWERSRLLSFLAVVDPERVLDAETLAAWRELGLETALESQAC